MVEHIDINGARLAYRLCGPDTAPLLITLHGGRGMGKPTPATHLNSPQLTTLSTSTSQERTLRALHLLTKTLTQPGDHKSDFGVYSQLSDAFRVLSFDFRGHGQSSRTKPYTFAQLVDDIEGLRRHFSAGSEKPEQQQVVICGGSFGGFLALHYAIKYAPHVSHLILRGTAASHHRESHHHPSAFCVPQATPNSHTSQTRRAPSRR